VESFYKRDALVSEQDLQNTVSFFENAARDAVSSGNSTELSTAVEEGFQSVYDIVDGKTSIAGVIIKDPSSVKNFVLPGIWNPWCRIVRCPEPIPFPKCDPTICDPIEDPCRFGFCGPIGPRGPIFPLNPVVDPIDPDFALGKLKDWATGTTLLELSPSPQLSADDVNQLVSGLGNLATSWRVSREAVSPDALSVRSTPVDNDLEKRLSTTQLKLVVIILIILL
jgi:hypothetical protein